MNEAKGQIYLRLVNRFGGKTWTNLVLNTVPSGLNDVESALIVEIIKDSILLRFDRI